MQSVLVAEAAGEIDVRTILLCHSQGRRKGDPKHKCCGKKHFETSLEIEHKQTPKRDPKDLWFQGNRGRTKKMETLN